MRLPCYIVVLYDYGKVIWICVGLLSFCKLRYWDIGSTLARCCLDIVSIMSRQSSCKVELTF